MSTKQVIRPQSAASSTSTSSVHSNGSECTMATPQKHILPAKLRTETESAVLTKRLLAAAVSTVCYLRGIFPSDCFIDKRLPDKSKAKVLCEPEDGEGHCGVARLLQLLQGAFDALDKRYLRAFNLGISCDRNNPDVVYESYTFTISYNEDGTASFSLDDQSGRFSTSKNSYAATKESVIQVMHELAFMIQRLDPVPGEPFVTVKLLYYDDRTPKDYEPPGFMSSKTADFQFVSNPAEGECGAVCTKFHSIEFGLRTVLACTEDEEAELVELEECQNGETPIR